MIIYPEFVKEALLNPELTPYLTGKFAMITKFDNKQNQYLEINIELQEGSLASTKLKSITKKSVRQKLIEKSSEFAEVSKSPNSQRLLRLSFWPHEHSLYFKQGVKQKWVVQANK
jgi:phenylacetate-CoA ligase